MATLIPCGSIFPIKLVNGQRKATLTSGIGQLNLQKELDGCDENYTAHSYACWNKIVCSLAFTGAYSQVSMHRTAALVPPSILGDFDLHLSFLGSLAPSPSREKAYWYNWSSSLLIYLPFSLNPWELPADQGLTASQTARGCHPPPPPRLGATPG